MASTIVALATPLGRSGIGIIRLSGPDALGITRCLTGEDSFEPIPRRAVLRKLTDAATNETADEALITYFKAPHSFTGEDVVEVSCHGSPVILRQIIDQALASGARLAGPGEFSLRAVANGRIDLSEAEAIRDLINSQTYAAARQSVKQMRGEFSHRLGPIKDQLLDVIVILESALEFVEDDLPAAESDAILAKLDVLRSEITQLAATFRAGKLIREGLRVALIGRPNVGKSSLFNALLGDDRAIVTEVAGTTRDQIHERFTIRDIPISLIDTAGLRETFDLVESIGVERSKRTMADADLVLVVLDVSEPVSIEDIELVSSVKALPHLLVFNKVDKVDADEAQHAMQVIADAQEGLGASAPAPMAVSATTGLGLDELKEAMVLPFADDAATGEGFLVSDARHHDLLIRAADAIEESILYILSGRSEEIVLVGLHNSLKFLGEITGETTTENMLTRIFSTFCIGK